MLDNLDILIGFALIFAVVSLLVTIVVQVLTSVFNLRGKNLAWGLAEAFEAIAPELKAEAKGRGKQLADRLLRDPLISDSQLGRWVFRAQAVRPAELFAVLRDIAIGKRAVATEAVREDVIVLLQSLGIPRQVFASGAGEDLGALIASLDAGLAVLPEGPARDALRRRKEEAEAALAKGVQAGLDAAGRWVALAKGEAEGVYRRFEQWFEIGQERSQEWFATHARMITAAVGAASAFLLQLDAVEIFRKLSSDKELRASLVAQTSVVLGVAERTLSSQASVLQDALKEMVASRASGAGQTPWPSVEVTATDTPEAVRSKIQESLRDRPEPEIRQALDAFDAATRKVVEVRLRASSQDYRTLQGALGKSGFSLLPGDGNGWNRWKAELGDACPVFSRHGWGMLFSAMLLSLGAPFWFNALKTLTSLRSSVAENIEGERNKAAPSGSAASGSQTSDRKPPPSVMG